MRTPAGAQAEPHGWVRRARGFLPSRPRRQPPVESPLPLSAITDAVRELVFERGHDPRIRLNEVLAREYSADEVVLCDSGTSALSLAIRSVRARGLSSGPVGLPAFSCYDVGAAAVGADVPITFYDLDPETLAPDPDSLLAALQRGTRCLVVSPLYGTPVEWGPLQGMADSYGAVLIEDAAQGQGATLDGRRLGAFGRVSVVSFGRGKGWTGGRGGAVLARGMGGPPFAGGARLTTPGWTEEAGLLVSTMAQSLMSHPSRYWLPASIPWLHLGRTTYHAPGPTRSMTRLAAGVALRTFRMASEAVEARRRVASWLARSIHFTERVRPIRTPKKSAPGFLRYPVLFTQGSRGVLAATAAGRLGVESSYPLTLPELTPLQAHVSGPMGRFPGALALSRGLVTLPTHSGLGPVDMQEILQLFDGYVHH